MFKENFISVLFLHLYIYLKLNFNKNRFVKLAPFFSRCGGAWRPFVLSQQRVLPHPCLFLCACWILSHLKDLALTDFKWFNICIPSICSKEDSLSGAKSSLLNISRGILSQYISRIFGSLFQWCISLPKSIWHLHMTWLICVHLTFFFFFLQKWFKGASRDTQDTVKQD